MMNIEITFDTKIACEEPYDGWAGIEIAEEELEPFEV